MKITQATKDNFFKKVRKGPHANSCWAWTGSKHRQGYGFFAINSVVGLAHRASLEIHGVKIPKGMNALHTCDTPECTNPKHLYLGTQSENNRDAVDRKRRFYARTGLCRRGHPLDGIRRDGTKRYCKTCNREGNRRRREK